MTRQIIQKELKNKVIKEIDKAIKNDINLFELKETIRKIFK